MTGTLHEDHSIFMIVSRSFIPRMRKCFRQTDVVEKNKPHFLCSIIFFLKIVLLDETMWENMATDDNLLRRMRIACSIPKATNTHSQ